MAETTKGSLLVVGSEQALREAFIDFGKRVAPWESTETLAALADKYLTETGALQPEQRQSNPRSTP